MDSARDTHDGWERRNGFDLWSIPHFLFGVLMGMIPFFTEMSNTIAFVLMLALAAAWEVYEKFAGIKETARNIWSDFILPTLAFVLTAWLFHTLEPDTREARVIAVAILTLYIFMNIRGWLAHRRRIKAKR